MIKKRKNWPLIKKIKWNRSIFSIMGTLHKRVMLCRGDNRWCIKSRVASLGIFLRTKWPYNHFYLQIRIKFSKYTICIHKKENKPSKTTFAQRSFNLNVKANILRQLSQDIWRCFSCKNRLKDENKKLILANMPR